MDNNKENFIADHKWQEDSTLLALPAQGPFTSIILFVCTYVAKFNNINISPAKLTEIMCASLHGPLIALNSNYGHACQPGYEHLLKFPKPSVERKTPMRGRVRKIQGNGTCFCSAIEPILAIDHPGIREDKIYKLKCFPTTGETQVPGVICADLSDGHAVLNVFINYLNDLKIGIKDPLSEDPDSCLQITAVSEQPKMLNYKFRINRNSPRILVNLRMLAIYLNILEVTKLVEGATLSDDQKNKFAGWSTIVLPPYPVRETKPPIDDVKVSFRFRGQDRAPRINIFQEGKINILGADSVNSASRIYKFFSELFVNNWAMLICLQPRRDLERRQVARRELERVQMQSIPSLTNDEFDKFFEDIYTE